MTFLAVLAAMLLVAVLAAVRQGDTTRDSPPVTPVPVPGTGSSTVPGQGGGFEEWDIEAEWASLHWGETT